MHDFAYVAHGTLGEVLSLLAERRQGARLLAGGTSLVPQMRLLQLPGECPKGMDLRPSLLISLRRMRELDRNWSDSVWVHLGALSTMRTLVEEGSDGSTPLLAEAAAGFGSPEIRNMATMGGNVCNASPAGTLLAPLLSLGAEVRLVSADGERFLPMSDFYRGPHRTARRDDELLAEIRVPRDAALAPHGYSFWSTRPALGMLLAAAACIVVRDNSGQPRLRLACSPSTGRPIVIEQALGPSQDPSQAVVSEVLSAFAGQKRSAEACHFAKDHPQYPEWYTERRIAMCVREACSLAWHAWSERPEGLQ